MTIDLGPYCSYSQIKGARYLLITPGDQPFMARIVAEVPDLEMARKIIELFNAQNEERTAMQLAAISVASLQNTRESAKQRIGRDNPNWTPAYADVCKAVDREIDEREKCEECDHDWRFVEHAYEGDPNVPNGTRDFKVFRCEKCGEEENRA